MPECPRCETRYSGAARLCRNCGGPLPESAAAAEPGVAVVDPAVGIRACAGCGRIVPAKRAACAACSDARTLAEPRVAAPRPDGAYWARVACTYACSGCGARTHLGSFDAEGRSVCVGCGHAQAQPVTFWRVVLTHAHAVADLAGPHAEGHAGVRGGRASIAAKNPYKAVGLEIAEVAAEDDHVRDDDDLPRDLVAGPGWPPCGTCGAAVDASFGLAHAPCASCGANAVVVLPASARVNRSLEAVLGTPPRAAERRAFAHVVALACPNCNAPLTVTEGADQATCRYCQTTSLVERAERAKPAGAATPWYPCAWLLFGGPSRKRIDLEQVPGA